MNPNPPTCWDPRALIRELLPLMLLAAASVGSLRIHASSHDGPPNVILVMCDDLGWGDVGFNGNTVIHTPHLDALAARGMIFDRFYAGSSVCSPTRGSVLTGRHPYRYGVTNANTGHLLPREVSAAEILQGRGYRTGHFGKWHLGTLTRAIRDSNRGGPGSTEHYAPPWEHGFDVCFSTEAKVPTYDPMLKPSENASGKGWDAIPDRSTAVPYNTRYWNHHGDVVTDNLEGANSRVIMDRAIPFIEQSVNDQSPFFAVIWFHTPHLPVVASPRHAALYANHDSSYARNYYGCITAMDEQVGRLWDSLDRLSVAEDTFLAFCSDNGPEGQAQNAPGTAAHFRGRKRDLYEGGIRVPAFVVWPHAVRAGQRSPYPAVTSDYLPTLQALLSRYDPGPVEVPQPRRPLDGISLLPALDGTLTARPEPIGFEYRHRIALTDNRYKLINVEPEQPPQHDQLYDLFLDPSETHNLAQSHGAIVRQMRARLDAWRESCRRDARQ